MATTDNGFQFNLWWLGENPIQNIPIGGGLQTQNDKLKQNNNILQLTVKQGVIQNKNTSQQNNLELKPVTQEQLAKNIQILTKKQQQNNLVLKF